MDRATQGRLLERVRQGDGAAFALLYGEYRPRVYRFLARMTRNAAAAEEILQEVWTKLATNAQSLAHDTDLGAWLFTVARNAARDHSRSERTSPIARPIGPPSGASGFEPVDHPSEGQSPFDRTAALETMKRVQEGLATLKPDDREVLLLIGVEGLSHEDAAKILGLTREATRQRLARARARLGTLLEGSVMNPTKVPFALEQCDVRH
jgi:RNA polymerase sigma factor (sigma-70 family)